MANKKIMTVWTKYRVEFGITDGTKGAYLGDNIAELHKAIDNDKRLNDMTWLKSILKYGYFYEFKDNPYKTTDYVIDNCMHFMWTVRENPHKEQITDRKGRELI